MADDRILIKDLMLRGIIGINDWEREHKQDILINITLFLDLKPAGASDRIEDTANYRTLTKQIVAYVESSVPFTVEALASEIARMSVGTAGVERALVRVEKPGALRFARSVGVEIERSARDFA